MNQKKIYCLVSAWETTYGGNDGNGGVHVFEMQPDGSLVKTDRVNEELAIGYLSIAPDGKHVYGINETKHFSNTAVYGGSVLAYELDRETGKLNFLNCEPTVGVFPCFLTMTNEGTHLIATNYGSMDCLVHSVQKEDGSYTLERTFDEGSVVMLPIRADGTVAPVSSLTVHTKTSVDPKRQISVHPHSVNVDPKDEFAMVCDRGGDRIYAYRIDKQANRLVLAGELKVREGTGPRHLVFHPTEDVFYVVSELLPYIAAYSYDRATGAMEEINMISVEPEKYVPRDYNNFGACTHPADVHIHPNGAYVYSSNRGHNSISTFAVDPQTKGLSYVTSTPSQGITPRTFAIDPTGRYMMVANQDTSTVFTFALGEDGTLTPTGSVAYVDQPVCIKFVEV